MNRNHLHQTISIVILLLAMIACARPAQTIQPTAMLDPNAIETSIVGTLEAAANQTEQAGLVATVPAIVPTETLTQVPEISSSGTSLVYPADGSTQFTDYVAGIQMVFPPGWLVVRVGEEEYYATWERKETQSPEFLNMYSMMQDQDPNVFRGHAFDVRPGYMFNGNITDISVVFQADDTQPLKEWEKEFRSQPLPFEGFKIISSSYPQTSNGIPVLVMEASWLNTDGSTNYYRYVFFSVPSGTVHLDFGTSLDYKDVVLPDLDQVVNSIKLINP
jgi:hypothetical protein